MIELNYTTRAIKQVDDVVNGNYSIANKLDEIQKIMNAINEELQGLQENSFTYVKSDDCLAATISSQVNVNYTERSVTGIDDIANALLSREIRLAEIQKVVDAINKEMFEQGQEEYTYIRSDICVADTVNPVVTIFAPTEYSDTTPFQVNFTFTEDVIGFTLGDITVGGGTAGNFIPVSASNYTADITPASAGPGDITVDVNAAVCQDIAGNPNDAAIQIIVSFFDPR